jgi:two-component system nitrogen regulation sensor histidine kinase GlnL
MHPRLFDHLNTAILLLDAQWQVQYTNLAAEQLFCHGTKHLKSAPFPHLFPNSSIDWARLSSVFLQPELLTDHDVYFEFNNQFTRVSLCVTPFEYNDKSLLLFELHAVETHNTLKQEKILVDQQQATHDLIRGLAHEIKNPLGGLRGAAQLLHQSLPNPELQEYTEMIISQADRLRTLVDDLLGSQKPQQYQYQNIHRILERVHQLIECEFGSWLSIKRDYDPSLPDIEIIPNHLEQTLLNLARNAAQALIHQDAPQLTLKTRTEHHVLLNGKQQPLVARIDVIDNGEGIPEEQQSKIFYPSVSGRTNGSGLGLTIANRLIQELGGRLSVESRPKHTQFTVRLPFTPT